MRSALVLLIGLAALPIAVSAISAQDVPVPMPKDNVAPDSAPAPEQIPDPTAILQDDRSTFTIPIPGGGDIQVHGPESETPTTISPIENWATQRTNPFSVGTSPLGPIPSQQ